MRIDASALVRGRLEIRSCGYARVVTVTELGLPALRNAAHRDPARPADPRLVDSFGRVATDLRISLTDRCNLRCSYCMPAEGLDWMPRDEQLTDDELVRLVTIAVHDLGVRELRFTGGEPLLRRGLEDIIAASAALRPRPDISLTTNGIGLARRAKALAAAGVNRLNVSMDTIRPDRFATITRRDRLTDVLDGHGRRPGRGPRPHQDQYGAPARRQRRRDRAAAAVRHGARLRAAVHRADAAGRAARLAARPRWSPRARSWTALRAEFTLTPDPNERGGAPAERWVVDGGPAVVGVIASVTRPFCGACDRTRLTADGQIRSCLFARTETDLRGLLRGGASDGEIADTWRVAMWGKLAGHGIDDPGFLQPDRPMSAIGG